MKAQRIIGKAADTDEPYRESIQAKRWAGHAIGEVLDIDTTEKSGKARVQLIIKQWIKTDVLRVDKVEDPRQGREIQIMVVGTWINREEAGL